MNDFSFELAGDHPLQIELKAGQTLFVLGANGSGKSSLMARLSGEFSGKVTWLAAHRRN